MPYYHRRHSRRKKPKLPFQFSPETDLPFLGALNNLQLCDAIMLSLHLPRSIYQVRSRLQKMYQYQVIERLDKRKHDLPGEVYGLGNRGADYLATHGQLLRKKIDWQKKNAERKYPKIEHLLMGGWFRIATTHAARESNNVILRGFQREHEALYTSTQVADERLILRPDHLFWLELLGRPKPFKYSVVEIDTGSETHYGTATQTGFQPKLVAWWHGRKHYLDILQPIIWGAKQEQIKDFQVLTVCRSQERAENLRRLAREVTGYQKGDPMFLFTTQQHYLAQRPTLPESATSQERREAEKNHLQQAQLTMQQVFQPIWFCPSCDNPHSIIE